MTAENVGAALGRIAVRFEQWKQQRAELAKEMQHVLQSASAMLGEIGETAGEAVDFVKTRTRRGGRPKGFRVSAATRRKLRAAWKRRKRAVAEAVKAVTD
ncbi:MAG: hypothetical protein IT184_11645 [Acidobacteria bacterium]|nr:hypothetical protein [Acidobacteriota bacterium]